MTTPTSTPARDRLAANHQKAGDLRGRIAELWATAERGEEVDPAAITTAEAEVAVADRLTAVLQRAALAEQVAETEAKWATVEADALAQYKTLAANHQAAYAAATAALAELADQAVGIHHHVDQFVRDPRRPPKLGVDGTPQTIYATGERATVAGVQMRGPLPTDVVAAATADTLDHLAERTGQRTPGPLRQQLDRIRASTQLPRKATK